MTRQDSWTPVSQMVSMFNSIYWLLMEDLFWAGLLAESLGAQRGQSQALHRSGGNSSRKYVHKLLYLIFAFFFFFFSKNVVLLITEHLGMDSSRSMLCLSVENSHKCRVLRTNIHWFTLSSVYSKIFNAICVKNQQKPKNHAEIGFCTSEFGIWFCVLNDQHYIVF